MAYNPLKLAFKSLQRNRLVAGINLLGLALGFAVCTLIFLMVLHERDFDRFHSRFERIYRLNTISRYDGMAESAGPYSSYPMGPFLANTFEKEIENYTRLSPIDQNFVLTYKGQANTIRQVFAVDTSFFQVFDFPLLVGNPRTVFADEHNVVLSKQKAEEIFGHTDVLGKVLTKTYANPFKENQDTVEQFKVSGVLAEIPSQSHLQFDMLFHIKRLPFWAVWNPDMVKNWHAQAAITYVTLRSDKVDVAALEKAIPKRLKARMQESDKVGHQLQALKDIHLRSGKLQDGEATNHARFDEAYLLIFGAIGLFILFIACINYSNLSTIIAGRRGREIAVRKTIGASQQSIVFQFLNESILMTSLALAFSVAFIFLLRPFLLQLEYPLEALNYLWTPGFGLAILASVFILGIVSGAYPAFVVSRFLPVKIFRGSKGLEMRRSKLVPALVVLQFTAAIVLVVCTLVSSRQLNFVLKSDMGYATDQIMVADLGMSNIFKSQVVKSELEKLPGVVSVALSDQTLGNGLTQNGVKYQGKSGKLEHISIPRVAVDQNFMDFYHMKLVAGKGISAEGPAKGNEYLINETLAKQLGWTPQEAIGKQMRYNEMTDMGQVVGVVKDFHFNSLYQNIEPLCMRASNWTTSISVKVSTKNLSSNLAAITKAWQRIIPDKPFDYEFMDDRFAAIYAAESRLNRLTQLGSSLAIFIACLGLFGLATYAVERRTKEIGIRKVMGASISSITALLSREFIRLVIVATLIAGPIAWYLSEQWLQNFSYRISPQWWMFLAAGLGAAALAFLTISIQSIKAALSDPVKSLRND
jgi:putative ABC transport system permease protein